MNKTIPDRTFEKYQTIFKEKGFTFQAFLKGKDEIKRFTDFLIKMNSIFLLPQQNEIEVNKYVTKLFDHANNFILMDGHTDIGIISFYANDMVNKTAFVSSIAFLPSYQGKKIGYSFGNFVTEYAIEKGMEYIKCEINMDNVPSLALAKKQLYKIQSETERNTYILIKKLKQ